MLERSRSLMTVTTRPDRLMVRGQGSFLWDDQGRRYLDFIQGWAVNALGHAAPEMAQALARQASLLITASPALYNAPQIELAERLVKLTGLHRVGFCNSGAEANEAAIKLARKWGRLQRHGASEIVTTEQAFHGRTLAAMAASGKPGWDELFPPNMPGFRRVPFGDIGAVRRHVAGSVAKTAAIMVEPIQGEAGVIVPPPGYLRGLRQLADEFGVLLVFDEVQTGLGRTGSLFAFEHEGVLPDILTLGKGLGGGVPLSAVLANQRADCFAPGDQGGTYHGNPLMTAVGNAVVDQIARPEFLATVRARGAILERGLGALASRHGGSVRGRGLLWAIELPVAGAESVRDACFERGLIINAARPRILRFMPSLRVAEEDIASMLDTLDSALAEAL
jgi:acetylornithine/N-succinyldiaminopimelate aminotransferase